jgi:hypothetical protein
VVCEDEVSDGCEVTVDGCDDSVLLESAGCDDRVVLLPLLPDEEALLSWAITGRAQAKLIATAAAVIEIFFIEFSLIGMAP